MLRAYPDVKLIDARYGRDEGYGVIPASQVNATRNTCGWLRRAIERELYLLVYY